MVRKSVVEEPEYHRRGDKSTIANLVQFDNSSDLTHIRSCRPKVFCKKDILRNFAKFTGKHLCQSLFFNKAAGLRQLY